MHMHMHMPRLGDELDAQARRVSDHGRVAALGRDEARAPALALLLQLAHDRVLRLELAHQTRAEVRALRPQPVHLGRVAVRAELAAQVQPEYVPEMVGEDVVVGQLGRLDVERQVA